MKAFWGFITLDIRQQRFYEAPFSCNHHFIFHSFIPLFLLAILFLSVPIHPSDGKKPGSENFETLCAGAQKKCVKNQRS